MLYSYKITVSGIVQGVGFRPFIYRIALRSNVKGYVKNLGGGEVEIHVEGHKENVAEFMRLLFLNLPISAQIESIHIEESDTYSYSDFKILPSLTNIRKPSEIPPDFAVCDECMREVLDPSNRRYKYPFNSCAYCGPRFSMMYKLPYDREDTSMNDFPLCDECKTEYYDPNNERRFDAQGISCPKCGPRLFLETIDGEKIKGDPIEEASKLIKEGFIVAIKGIGGYHIAASPINDDVVLKLRERKNRPQQPFALMALDIGVIEKYAYVSDVEKDLLTSPQRPIVLLRKKEPYELSKYLSPGLDKEGFFLYYTPLHYLLLDSVTPHVLIMTSGNKHGFPMCINEECVRKKLKGIVDYVLYHNRKIINRVDDSILRISENRILFLRRSRGYAPTWIRLRRKVKKPVISFGAELQNVGALAFEDKVVLTQYIGDTDELDTLNDLDRYLRLLISCYDVKPKVVVADKNPVYQTTYLARKVADEYSAEFIQIQHHYAHILSVAADHGYAEGIGIAIDGIGYGDDGNAWGGEIIKFNEDKYERKFHLKYVPYTGGDLNALRPERMLALFLSTIMSWEEVRNIVKLDEKELDILQKLTKKATLLTSSTGRVLDAVSAFLGICKMRTYEGEPAMKLESSAKNGKILDLEIPIRNEEIDTTVIFRWLLENNNKSVNDLAITVQYRLGESLIKAALKLNPERVFISGGAAVNEYILRGVIDNSEGIEILTPRRVPAGDGGISLGQSYYMTFL